MAAVTKRSQARVAIKRKKFISLDTSMGSLGNSCFPSVSCAAFSLGVLKAASQGTPMLQLIRKGRECGMWKSPHPGPALAHVTSAYVSPVRTQSMVTPSCKGGWECIRLQFSYSSRTDLGSSCHSGYHVFFICSLIHPHFPRRARPFSVGVL